MMPFDPMSLAVTLFRMCVITGTSMLEQIPCPLKQHMQVVMAQQITVQGSSKCKYQNLHHSPAAQVQQIVPHDLSNHRQTKRGQEQRQQYVIWRSLAPLS